MKMIFNDKSEISVINFSQELFRETGDNRSAIHIEIEKDSIDTTKITEIFADEKLIAIQFVSDAHTVSYDSYKLMDASMFMDDSRSVISVTIVPVK